MISFERKFVSGCECRLSVVDFGNAGAPDMVLLHGTHDHALGMYPAVANLLDQYHVVSLDLRG